MKLRALLAGTLLTGALTVLPATTASACGFAQLLECGIHIDTDTGKISTYDHSPDFSDATKYAQPAPAENVERWKRDYWFDFPRNAEQSQDWLANLAKGGPNNPNWGARAKARAA